MTVIHDWEKMAVHRGRKNNSFPKIPCASEILEADQWAGEPCVILGGGPSINGVRGRLGEFPKGTHFAGPNQSWRLTPSPEIVYVVDRQVLCLAEMREHKELWRQRTTEGQIRLTNKANGCYGPWLNTYWVEISSPNDWGRDFANVGIVAANNAGLGTINVVDILGADPIILLGFDGKTHGNNMNWHSDYPDEPGWKPKRPELSFQKWMKAFALVVGKCRGKVYNANPDSAYTMFEKITFDEALSLCKAKEVIEK